MGYRRDLHGAVDFDHAAPETLAMRIIYLALGLFILINIGAACRTPTEIADGCERVSGGLVHCATTEDERG